MGFSGRLEGIDPSDIFQIISQGKMTGTLIARCADGTAMVVFKKGQVIEAASDASQESLGNLLISQGIVSETTLAEAQARQKQRPDAPLGAVLVEMGVISEQALESVVLKQIELIVHRLVSCEDGFITFDRGEMALKRKLNTREFLLPDGVSAEYLLMERVRSIDEKHKDGPAQPASAGARLAFPGGEPAREELPSDRKNEAHPTKTALLKSLFHEIRFPKATDIGGMTGTLVLKVKQIGSSADGMLDRYVVPVLVPWLETAGRKVRELSAAGRTMALKVKTTASTAGSRLYYALLPLLETVGRRARELSSAGRTMALVGITAIAAGIVLILATTLSFHTTESVLLVSKPVANIRVEPSIDGKVIAQAGKGETFSSLASTEGWHKVQAQAGTGWISERMVERKDNKRLTVAYTMKGYELVFLAGLALFLMGIMKKKVSS
jgi:hypothetical protein